MSGRIGCDAARARITARASGLTSAQRIALEEHVESCAACAAVAREIDALSTVLDGGPSLSASARERVVERALGRAVAGGAEVDLLEPSPRIYLGGARATLGALALAAAAIAVAVWLWRSDSGEAPGDVPAPFATDEPERAPAPNIEQEVAPEREIDSFERSLDEGEVLELAHARLEAMERSRIAFDADTTTVALVEGSILFDVDPSAGAPFAVAYAEHRIEVIGTRFVVGNGEVRVMEGTVRVRDARGRVRATLGEGRTLDLAPAEPETSEELARARALLSRRDVAGARAILRALERRPLRPAERAEAGSLVAEAHALSSENGRAIEAYLSVVEAHPDLPAGENALFAAARLAARTRDTRATALFERYLARYPNGRFADEARSRLHRGGAR
jgi:hypothetical protein